MENRVGFGMRLGAALIDVVIIGVLAFVLGGTIGGMLGAAAGGVASAADSSASAMGGMAVGGIIGSIVGILAAAGVIGIVYGLIEGFTGWTFGKLILGIQVGNPDGTRAALGTLLTRYALKNCNLLLTVGAALTGIGLLGTLGKLGGLAIFVGCFFVLTPAKQAFHDMIAKTAVYPRAKLA